MSRHGSAMRISVTSRVKILISGMREDRLVADFLLSIIDRFTEGILVVCVNSFYIGKSLRDVLGV